MIRKCLAAREQGAREVRLWGDGTPTREFLYVEDAAEAFVLAAERYDGAEPVNIGTGEEIAIRDLARQIAAVTGFEGELVWDASQPNGQPRRRLDVTRARERFGFTARVPFADGLRRTVAWARETRQDRELEAP
jgi:GDP-L-fucose synthase